MFQRRFHSRGADSFKAIYRRKEDLEVALTNMELVPWTLYDIRCQILISGEPTTGRVKMNHKQGKIFTRMNPYVDSDEYDLDHSEEVQGSSSAREAFKGTADDDEDDDVGPSQLPMRRRGQP